MRNLANTNQSNTAVFDWLTYYENLEQKGQIPNASKAEITRNTAIFRGMYHDLLELKAQIKASGFQPKSVTIYTDVLVIPEDTLWLLEASALIIFARRIEVTGKATLLLNGSTNAKASLVIFCNECQGELTLKATTESEATPTVSTISQAHLQLGLLAKADATAFVKESVTLKQGMAFQLTEDTTLYLNHLFIYGALLYDQNPELAISLFLWVKGWAAQRNTFQELFYKSTNMATLLSAEVNAKKNGAVFVPYLTSSIYVEQSQTFANAAAKYEANYRTLSTQEVLTSQNIELAKTMTANSQSEIDFIKALLEQANTNLENAETAVKNAEANFSRQERIVRSVAINFEQIGIPEYKRKAILNGIVDVVTSLVTFGAAISSMSMGNVAAGPAAASGAVSGVKAVSSAASTGAQVVQLATDLAKTMEVLQELLETLQNVLNLAKAVQNVAKNISIAENSTESIQELQDSFKNIDLSAADNWEIFKIQSNNAMADSIALGIGFAKAYQEALDILVVYGQSLSAAQLAVIKASQEVSALTFQLHYAKEKEENLQNLVDTLEEGQAPRVDLMQQFYQKYIDSKSAMFSALKFYKASHFYWALQPSLVQPRIIDPVEDLNAGVQELSQITMDKVNALEMFNPPPQEMTNIIYEIDDPTVIANLQESGKTSWVLPLNDTVFSGLERLRLDNIRVWIEGTSAKDGAKDYSVYAVLTNTGNYRDRYNSEHYQFNSKILKRVFKYGVTDQDFAQETWKFDNKTYGVVQLDGEVDKEVSYAYFRPTPFSEWTISLQDNNPNLDYSKVSKITMYFEGSAIGVTAADRARLAQKQIQFA